METVHIPECSGSRRLGMDVYVYVGIGTIEFGVEREELECMCIREQSVERTSGHN